MNDKLKDLTELLVDMMKNGASQDEIEQIIWYSKVFIDGEKMFKEMKEKYSNS